MEIIIKPLNQTLRADFFRLHSKETGCDWCNCTAWWVPTWEEFSENSRETNLKVREDLFKKNCSDGFLFYKDNQVIGWCQCFQRDAFAKLVKQYSLEPDKEIFALTCMKIHPDYRKQGLSHKFLELIIEHLKEKGIKLLQGFPKSGSSFEDGDVWTGPESIFIKAGFKKIQSQATQPVYQVNIG